MTIRDREIIQQDRQLVRERESDERRRVEPNDPDDKEYNKPICRKIESTAVPPCPAYAPSSITASPTIIGPDGRAWFWNVSIRIEFGGRHFVSDFGFVGIREEVTLLVDGARTFDVPIFRSYEERKERKANAKTPPDGGTKGPQQ